MHRQLYKRHVKESQKSRPQFSKSRLNSPNFEKRSTVRDRILQRRELGQVVADEDLSPPDVVGVVLGAFTPSVEAEEAE
jgi:hypothetical protein